MVDTGRYSDMDILIYMVHIYIIEYSLFKWKKNLTIFTGILDGV